MEFENGLCVTDKKESDMSTTTNEPSQSVSNTTEPGKEAVTTNEKGAEGGEKKGEAETKTDPADIVKNSKLNVNAMEFKPSFAPAQVATY